MKRILVILSCILFLAGTVVFSPLAFAQTAKDYYRSGYDKFHEGNFSQAVSDYTKAIGLDKDYKDAYLARGLAYDELNNFDKSIEDYTRVIELNSWDMDAYRSRGNAYGSQGKFDLAIADYTKAIEIKPTSNAYDDRAIAYMKQGDFEKAYLDFDKAIETNPLDERPYYDRGLAYNMQGKPTEAIADYTKMLELQPDSPNGLNNRGLSYLEIGENDQAIADFSRAIELVPIEVDPLHTPPYIGRARAYLRKGDYNRALKDCDTVLKVSPEAPRVARLRKNIISLRGSKPAREGEIFYQKDGLFKAALPKGWRWMESPGEVGLINPELKGGGLIKFYPDTTITDANMEEELKKANQIVIESFVKPFDGIILDEKATEINGIYARRLDFSTSTPVPGHTIEGTCISFEGTCISLFQKGNVFTISFRSRIQEVKAVLERIVQSLQFSDGQDLKSAERSEDQGAIAQEIKMEKLKKGETFKAEANEAGPYPAGEKTRVTVLLKSGQEITGEIIERTEGYIKLIFHGGTVTFYNDEIEKIE